MSIIIKLLLKKQIECLLFKIHKCYPTKFSVENLEYEKLYIWKYIDNNINIILNDSNQKKKIETNNEIKTINQKKKINNKKKISNVFKINQDKCMARVFDISYLEWKDTDGNIRYGRQCSKNKYNNENYCKLHLNKNSHGNINETPNLTIKDHFRSYKKYMNNNKKKFKISE